MEKNLGHATAYGYAKSKGYSGTEEEYAELMASYATVAEQAAESAESASASATSASASATTATTKASEASKSATQAGTKASQASTSATQASASATSASQSASTATQKASEASASASTASSKASEASASATSAQTAQGLAESARDDAIDAKTDAETARDLAQQYAESIDPDNIFSAYATDTASGSVATFADGADDIPMKSVVVNIEPVQSGSGDPSPDNVRPISGWSGAQVSHSGADRTNPTTYPITFPTEAGTVYGGTLDVTNGTLTVDRAMVTLDGSEVWNLQSINRYGIANFNTTIDHYPAQNFRSLCNMLSPQISLISSTETEGYLVHQNGSTIYIRIFSSRASTVSELMTWLASNPIQLVYALAEPITYHLTPTEIKSLLGDNNVWADAGDSTVEYRADTKLYIDKKIAEVINALS